jgi:hypothetical protein
MATMQFGPIRDVAERHLRREVRAVVLQPHYFPRRCDWCGKEAQGSLIELDELTNPHTILHPECAREMATDILSVVDQYAWVIDAPLD